MKTFLLKKLEKAINRYLALDPESKKRVRALKNKKMLIVISGVGTTTLFFDEETVHFDFKRESPTIEFSSADCCIKGTPLSLLWLVRNRHDRQSFVDHVEVTGSLEMAEAVMNLFVELEIDWEEYAAQIVGDVPAHHAGKVFRKLKSIGERARKTLLRNVNEYIHEEVELFPPPVALRHFYFEVDELRLDVDRMQARIDEIKAAIK